MESCRGVLNFDTFEVVEGRNVGFQNCTFRCRNGMVLAGQRWITHDTREVTYSTNRPCFRILCLHGFLDNCRSFAALLTSLLDNCWRKRGVIIEAYAFDWPGHGQSSHTSQDHVPTVTTLDLAYYIEEVVHILKWGSGYQASDDNSTQIGRKKGFFLMGHSMGGMASVLYAAAFPEYIQRLILLDSFGPDIDSPEASVKFLRKHLTTRYQGNRKEASNGRRMRIYRTIDEAILTRQESATRAPGSQWISYESAKEIVDWSILPLQDEQNAIKGWRFRHDPRWKWNDIHVFTHTQAFGFWEAVRNAHLPVLWLRAADGWPFPGEWLDFAETILGKHGTTKILPGSHHFHSDPKDVDLVSKEILEFITTALDARL